METHFKNDNVNPLRWMDFEDVPTFELDLDASMVIIDVSYYNKNIDQVKFEKALANEQIHGVIIRSSWGTTKDEKFEEYYRFFKKYKGLPLMSYHYVKSKHSAKDQIEFIKKIHKNKPHILKKWADHEGLFNILTGMASKTVEIAEALDMGVYSNRSLYSEKFNHLPFWFASYSDDLKLINKRSEPIALWQHTMNGYGPNYGFQKLEIDENKTLVNASEFFALLGINYQHPNFPSDKSSPTNVLNFPSPADFKRIIFEAREANFSEAMRITTNFIKRYLK